VDCWLGAHSYEDFQVYQRLRLLRNPYLSIKNRVKKDHFTAQKKQLLVVTA